MKKLIILPITSSILSGSVLSSVPINNNTVSVLKTNNKESSYGPWNTWYPINLMASVEVPGWVFRTQKRSVSVSENTNVISWTNTISKDNTVYLDGLFVYDTHKNPTGDINMSLSLKSNSTNERIWSFKKVHRETKGLSIQISSIQVVMDAKYNTTTKNTELTISSDISIDTMGSLYASATYVEVDMARFYNS